MKLRKWCARLLCIASLFALTGCGSSTNPIYVQSVAELSAIGGIAPGDRFGGLVVSENVAEITKDENRSVKELLVKEGEDVTEGQTLFLYDTDQLQLELDRKELELEQL